ncbi:hypothetical protein ACN5L6_004079 [Cronobacter dublinensis]
MDIIFTFHFWSELAKDHGYYIGVNALVALVFYIAWRIYDHAFWIYGCRFLLAVALVLFVIGGVKTFNKLNTGTNSNYNILSNGKN